MQRKTEFRIAQHRVAFATLIVAGSLAFTLLSDLVLDRQTTQAGQPALAVIVEKGKAPLSERVNRYDLSRRIPDALSIAAHTLTRTADGSRSHGGTVSVPSDGGEITLTESQPIKDGIVVGPVAASQPDSSGPPSRESSTGSMSAPLPIIPGSARITGVVAPRDKDRLQEKAESEPHEDPEAGWRWFLFQRKYPYDSLPADGRRSAWESRPGRAKQMMGPLAQQLQSWRSIGPTPTYSPPFGNSYSGAVSGHVNTIAISPIDSSIVLIGAASGGIWRSTDGGTSFIPVSDDQVDLELGSIAFSRSDPQIVYAGMGDPRYGSGLGTGVLKSTDAGQTWKRVSNSTLPTPGTTSKIAVDPSDPSRVYLAQYAGEEFSSGFYLSTDGGVNWDLTLPGLTTDLVIHPTDPRVLYLSMSRVDKSGNPPAGLYRSTDGGATWASIYSGSFDSYPYVRMAVTPAEPQTIYIDASGSVGGTFDYHVMVSKDEGATWNDLGTTGLPLKGASYVASGPTYLAVDPTNSRTLYLGLRDVYKSTDGGASWTNLTLGYSQTGDFTPDKVRMHVDQHALAFSPTNPNTLYFGNDGGVSKTTDGGTSFQSLNATLSLTQFYGLTMHPTNPLAVYGGTQDNGTQARSGFSAQWQVLAGGDGGPCVIDPLDPNIVFVSYTVGSIDRFKNGGSTFDAGVGRPGKYGETVSAPRISFIAPFTGNSVDATLYVGTWRLFVSSDLGNTWLAPAGTLDLTKGGNDTLSVISVAHSNPNVIYTGSLQGRVMNSQDAGKTWTDISAGVPNRSVTSISVDASNVSVAYLTVSGYFSGHVFKTINSGASWADISGNLPDIPTSALLVDPLNPNILYAGTDIGVFRSGVGGTSWEDFNNGMPPAPVFAMVAQPSGLIRLATYGRGAYELTANGQPLANAIDDAGFFVRQQYIDFLNRQPDQSGLAFWTNEITSCGTDRACIQLKRVNVSAAYFLSIEFQQTGYLVERIYKAAYGDATGSSTTGSAHQLAVPIVRFNEFLPDTQQIGQGVVVGQTGWETVLENNKQALAAAFVQRSRFTTALATSMTPAQFIDKLNQNAGNVLSSSERTTAIGLFGGAVNTSNSTARALALRQVAENQNLYNNEFNRAFVLMQYFGYLRRNPNDSPDSDYTGYDFWLTKLNAFGGNFVNAEMVKAFITSGEYRIRFGP